MEQPPRPKRRTLLLILVAALVVIGILVVAGTFDSRVSVIREKSKSADQIITYAQKNDYDWVRIKKWKSSELGYGNPYDDAATKQYSPIKTGEYNDISDQLSEDDMGCDGYEHTALGGTKTYLDYCESTDGWIVVSLDK